MDALVDGLLEELNCDVVFKIPIFGGIPIYESVVVTWIIMVVVFLLCFFLGRNLSVENPGRRQVAVEAGVKFLNDFFSETLGEKGKDYIPYLATVIIYIGIANLIGLLGFKPPTKDMNVTAALAVMSIVLIEVAGIRAKGTKRWLKSFAEPMPVILPINILEIFIKPLSLCMRLFGNVLGSFVIMELYSVPACRQRTRSFHVRSEKRPDPARPTRAGIGRSSPGPAASGTGRRCCHRGAARSRAG